MGSLFVYPLVRHPQLRQRSRREKKTSACKGYCKSSNETSSKTGARAGRSVFPNQPTNAFRRSTRVHFSLTGAFKGTQLPSSVGVQHGKKTSKQPGFLFGSFPTARKTKKKMFSTQPKSAIAKDSVRAEPKLQWHPKPSWSLQNSQVRPTKFNSFGQSRTQLNYDAQRFPENNNTKGSFFYKPHVQPEKLGHPSLKPTCVDTSPA